MSTIIEFYVKIFSELAGVVSVVVGVVMSIKSFNAARAKEAEARHAEALKPFRELRQKHYLDTLHIAAILSNEKSYSPDEILAAKKRFRELYVAELSMVESEQVANSMVDFAKIIDSELISFTPEQKEAYKLAHVLRDSFLASSGLSKDEAYL
jgi:hypothetical protein